MSTTKHLSFTHPDQVRAAFDYAQKHPKSLQSSFDDFLSGIQYVIRLMDGSKVHNSEKVKFWIASGSINQASSGEKKYKTFRADALAKKKELSGESITTEVKVPIITLWQPWASAVVTQPCDLTNKPIKENETRHWHTDIRGFVLIHAAKKMNKELSGIYNKWPFNMHHTALKLDANYLGCIVGAVEITDCITTEAWKGENFPTDDPHILAQALMGNFENERFVFTLANPIRFDLPIPFIGRQTPFSYVPLSIVPEQYRQYFLPKILESHAVS